MDYAQPMLIDAQPLLSNENIDWVVMMMMLSLPLDSNWRIMGTFTQQCFNGATHACLVAHLLKKAGLIFRSIQTQASHMTLLIDCR